MRDACLLIRYHDRPMSAERSDLLRVMGLFAGSGLDTPRLMNELFDIKRADTLGKAPSCFYYVKDIERMREMVRELLANNEAYSVGTLALSGADSSLPAWHPAPVSAPCLGARSMRRSMAWCPISATTCLLISMFRASQIRFASVAACAHVAGGWDAFSECGRMKQE